MNKVILIGRLGADPEMKYTPSGTPVTTFSVATSEKWTTRDGEKMEETEWHRVVACKRFAEICGKYLTKGSLISMEGKQKTRKWEDREGVTRYVTEVIMTFLEMHGGGRDKQGSSGSQESGSRYDEEPYGGSIPEDDIPF